MTTFPRLHIDDLATLSASGAYILTDGQVEVPVRYRKGTRHYSGNHYRLLRNCAR